MEKARKSLLLRLRREGLKQAEIAKIIEVSQPTVSWHCRRAGLGGKWKGHKHYSESVRERAIALYEMGYSCTEVVNLIGQATQRSVWSWVVDAGVARNQSEAAKNLYKRQKETAKRLARKREIADKGGEDD